MSEVAIQKTEIVGAPSDQSTVRLLLADNPEIEKSAEYVWTQVVSDGRNLNQLAAVQLRALQRARQIIAAQISALESQITLDTLRPE